MRNRCSSLVLPAVLGVRVMQGDRRGDLAIIELTSATQAAAVIERLQGNEVRRWRAA